MIMKKQNTQSQGSVVSKHQMLISWIKKFLHLATSLGTDKETETQLLSWFKHLGLNVQATLNKQL